MNKPLGEAEDIETKSPAQVRADSGLRQAPRWRDAGDSHARRDDARRVEE